MYDFETKKYIRNVGKYCHLGGKFYHVPGECHIFTSHAYWFYLHYQLDKLKKVYQASNACSLADKWYIMANNTYRFNHKFLGFTTLNAFTNTVSISSIIVVPPIQINGHVWYILLDWWSVG